jgi:hypothetical protein
MSGASIVAGNSLSEGGSVVRAGGSCCAEVVAGPSSAIAAKNRETVYLSMEHFGSSEVVLYSVRMQTLLRTIEFLGLSLWLGSDVFLSFVVAPGAFRILASRDSAGAIVGFGLGRMHLMGVVCGVAVLLARLLRTRAFASLAAPGALCVGLMILLTVVSQQAVSPKMAALRVQMGSIQATAANSPLLAEFGRLHRISASLEGCVLLAGMAALYLMVGEFAVGH